MSLPINRFNRVHFVGDSITFFKWFAVFGGLVDQIETRWQTQGKAIASPSVNKVATGVTPPRLLTVTSSGVIGDKIGLLQPIVAARITAFTPDVLFIAEGVNDASAGTAPATFRTAYDSVIAQCLAFNPAMKIGAVSILCYGEQAQVTGDHWGLNTYDANIALLNAQISGSAGAAGQTYIDIRTLAGVWELNHNLPLPGTVDSVLTQDQVHPNTGGQVMMGTWCMPSIAVGA